MSQLEYLSNRRLKQFSVSASTICAGNLFQLPTTRWLKINFLTFGCLLFCHWPRRLWRPLLRLKKFPLSNPLSIDSLPVSIWYVSMRSLRSLLLSSVIKPSRCRRYVECLNSGTKFGEWAVHGIACAQLRHQKRHQWCTAGLRWAE